MQEKTANSTGCHTLFYLLKEIRNHLHAAEWQQENSGGEDFIMLVITDGTGKIAIDGTSFGVKKGACFIVSPGESSSLTVGKTGLSFYSLTFSAWRNTGAAGRPERHTHFPCAGKVFCHPFSQCIDYVEAIYANRLARDERLPFETHLRFQQLLQFLFEQNLSGDLAWSMRQAVKNSIDHLKQHYRQTWTVDQLADWANVPRWQYTRMFKEITGHIPLDFLNGLRIDRAKQLLLTTDDRLFDIAQSVGISNEYYFNRRFKQTVGISPGQYRRNHQENIRVFAPFLEDFLVALGITPVVQSAHAKWGKQDYLNLQHVPALDFDLADVDLLTRHKPDFIMVEDGVDRWIAFEQFHQLAPTYKIHHPGEEWRSLLGKMADLLGKTDKVQQVIARYEQKASEARRILGRSARGQTVAFLRISAQCVCLYAGSEHGYTGPILYKDLGLSPHPLVRQLASQTRNVALTPEWLAKLDADHLFITFDKHRSDTEGAEKAILDTPVWRALPAVKKRCVYEVDFLTWMNYGVLSHEKKIDDVLKVLA